MEDMALTPEESDQIEELPLHIRKAIRLLSDSPSTIRAILDQHHPGRQHIQATPSTASTLTVPFAEDLVTSNIGQEESDTRSTGAQASLTSTSGGDPILVPQCATASALQKHAISIHVRVMGFHHVQEVYRKAPRGTTAANMHKFDPEYRGIRRAFRAYLQDLSDFKVGLTFSRHSLPAQGRIVSAMLSFCNEQSWAWGSSELTVTGLIMSMAQSFSTTQKRREHSESPKAIKRIKSAIENSHRTADQPEESNTPTTQEKPGDTAVHSNAMVDANGEAHGNAMVNADGKAHGNAMVNADADGTDRSMVKSGNELGTSSKGILLSSRPHAISNADDPPAEANINTNASDSNVCVFQESSFKNNLPHETDEHDASLGHGCSDINSKGLPGEIQVDKGAIDNATLTSIVLEYLPIFVLTSVVLDHVQSLQAALQDDGGVDTSTANNIEALPEEITDNVHLAAEPPSPETITANSLSQSSPSLNSQMSSEASSANLSACSAQHCIA